MSNLLLGFFTEQKNSSKLSNELEAAGFQNEEYILHKENKVEVVKDTNILNKLLGKNMDLNIVTNKLFASVETQSAEEENFVKNIFVKNKAVQIFEFKDMTIQEALDLEHIKKIIEIRAKSQIFVPSPIQAHHSSEGINIDINA